MRKLELKLEELAVESFDTGDVEGAKGTVEAFASSPLNCCTRLDSQCETCADHGCYYTQGCTSNPNDFLCINSKNYCDTNLQCTTDC